MSQYVRRCTGNHCVTKVKGNSAFRKLKGGGFADVCRFCEERDREILGAPIRDLALDELRQRERSLETQLANVRTRMRSLLRKQKSA